MSVATLTKVTLPHSNACYNLTDSADFATMGIGSGNGVQWTWNANDIVLMKNTTGGLATYTLKIPAITAITAVGGAVTNPTNAVTAAKTEIWRPDSVFADSNGLVTVECDVAGQILVLTP
jgi:hypothetical protein